MAIEQPLTTNTSMRKMTPHPRKRTRWNFKRTWPLHLMLLPAVLLTLLFAYVPMGGIIIAFQDFKPWLGFTGSKWVGWDNFRFMFEYPDSVQVIWNTVLIASMKIVAGLVAPVVFAILLNEVRNSTFKRFSQTLVYLPHFLSWVVLGGILLDMLSPEGGLVNQVLAAAGVEPIFSWEMATGSVSRWLSVMCGRSLDLGQLYFWQHLRALTLHCMRLPRWTGQHVSDRHYILPCLHLCR